MDEMISRRSLREYLEQRPNFIKAATWTFSSLFAAVLLLGLGKDGGFIYWLFLIALSFVGGRVFAHFAWRIVERDRQSRGT
jgi:hypothetical protein